MKKISPIIMNARRTFPGWSVTWEILKYKDGRLFLRLTIKDYHYTGGDAYMTIRL